MKEITVKISVETDKELTAYAISNGLQFGRFFEGRKVEVTEVVSGNLAELVEKITPENLHPEEQLYLP